MAVLSDIYTRLEEIVFDNLKVVSYKWLSREYQLRTAISKQILHSFWSKYRVQSLDKEHDNLRRVTAIFLVSGFSKNGNSHGLVVRLCSEASLTDVRQGFEKVTSEHVFSVQPAICKDMYSVWEEDHSQAKRLMSEKPEGANWMHNKGLGYVYCKNVEWAPNQQPASEETYEEPLPPKPEAPVKSLADEHKAKSSAAKPKPGKARPKTAPKVNQLTVVKSSRPPPQPEPSDPGEDRSSSENEEDIEMKVRIGAARRNNVIIDDDDGSNESDHVLRENDNVDNRPEKRDELKAEKDMGRAKGVKKQKIIKTHIDDDGNEVTTVEWVATEAGAQANASSTNDRKNNGASIGSDQENSNENSPKATGELSKKGAKATANGAQNPSNQKSKSDKGSKKGNQRSLTAFFGRPK